MRTLEWTTWVLGGLLVLSPVALAQDRPAGRQAALERHAVGERRAMQGRFRAIRDSRSRHTRSLLSLRNRLEQTHEVNFEGDNFVNIIPFVTNENGARTNIGINNFSRFSLFKGESPVASVGIGFYGPSGDLDRTGAFSVRANQMLQINRIVSALDPVPGGGTATTGWLLIFSDEPVTAWASVILDRFSNDPAMLLAIADQIFKPAAFVESQGTPWNPLLIHSSVKGGTFESRLAVVNVGSGDGRVRVNLFDGAGALQRTLPPVDLKPNGMFVSDDIRMTVPGTFGPVTIEVDDIDPGDGNIPRIVATSLIKSTLGNFAGFLPAFALPQVTTPSVAGVWEGSVTGEIMNAEVRLTLFQERDMLYGSLDILGGTFPTTDRFLLIRGAVFNGQYQLEIQEQFGECHTVDDPCLFFAYRLYAPAIDENESLMEGDTIYFDERGLSDNGRFRLIRKQAIYPVPADE